MTDQPRGPQAEGAPHAAPLSFESAQSLVLRAASLHHAEPDIITERVRFLRILYAHLERGVDRSALARLVNLVANPALSEVPEAKSAEPPQIGGHGAA